MTMKIRSYLLFTSLLMSLTYTSSNIPNLKTDEVIPNNYKTGKDCPQYCNKCLFDGLTCLKCTPSYLIDSKAQCQPCDYHCKECKGNQSCCTSCYLFYALNHKNECIFNPVGIYSILILSIIGVLLFTFPVLCWLIYKHRDTKKQDEKKEWLLSSHTSTEVIEDFGIKKTPNKMIKALNNENKQLLTTPKKIEKKISQKISEKNSQKKDEKENEKNNLLLISCSGNKSDLSSSSRESNTESGFTTSEFDDFESVIQGGGDTQNLPLEGNYRDSSQVGVVSNDLESYTDYESVIAGSVMSKNSSFKKSSAFSLKGEGGDSNNRNNGNRRVVGTSNFKI